MRDVGGPVISQGELRCSHSMCRERCGDLYYTVRWTFASTSRPGATSLRYDHKVCPECAQEAATAVFRQEHVLEVALFPHTPKEASHA